MFVVLFLRNLRVYLKDQEVPRMQVHFGKPSKYQEGNAWLHLSATWNRVFGGYMNFSVQHSFWDSCHNSKEKFSMHLMKKLIRLWRNWKYRLNCPVIVDKGAHLGLVYKSQGLGEEGPNKALLSTIWPVWFTEPLSAFDGVHRRKINVENCSCPTGNFIRNAWFLWNS